MPQSIILAPGNTSAASSDIVIAAGDVVTVGIYSAADAALPVSAQFSVVQDTPGADNVVDYLVGAKRAVQLMGPGTFRVRRPAYDGAGFGVFLET